MKKPVGIVRLWVFKRGRIIWTLEGANLFVNAGRPALAALLGGDTIGQFASAVGFGSGAAVPLVTDTGLTAPDYYKAVDSHSTDSLGSVTFNWTLTDPAVSRGVWAPNTAYALNDTVDPLTPDGHYFKATTAGTSGATEPVWNTTSAATTNDGTVVWTEAGVADTGAEGITIQELGLFADTGAVALPGTVAPSPLLSRKTIAPISFTAGMNITGSWTLTF